MTDDIIEQFKASDAADGPSEDELAAARERKERARLQQEAQEAADAAIAADHERLQAMPRETPEEQRDALLAHLARVVLKPDGWIFLVDSAELIAVCDPSLMPPDWKPSIDVSAGNPETEVEQAP